MVRRRSRRESRPPLPAGPVSAWFVFAGLTALVVLIGLFEA